MGHGNRLVGIQVGKFLFWTGFSVDMASIQELLASLSDGLWTGTVGFFLDEEIEWTSVVGGAEGPRTDAIGS